MAYRPRRGDWKGAVALFGLAGAYAVLKPLLEAGSEHWASILATVTAIVGVLWLVRVVARWASERARRAELLSKYRDERIVDAILEHRYWQGQTADMVLDSLGDPAATDRKVLHRTVSETWKYRPAGRGRYALRVVLDNGIVVGWDHKGG